MVNRHLSRKKRIFVKVTRDKYEHIIEMADTMVELAGKCGKSVDTIRASIHRDKCGKIKSQYKEVIFDDNDEIQS